MVLKQILSTAGIEERAAAETLGLGSEVFDEMLAGQREIPESMVGVFSATLGVTPELLLAKKAHRLVDVTPAIWFKLRGPRLTDCDREYVLIVRRLAYYQHELEEIRELPANRWKVLFETIRRGVDPQAAPAEQGRLAGKLFRAETGLSQGGRGIGEVFRGCLRAMGLLVFEASVVESELEGCSFYVGPAGKERPCIFANSYRTTWFRRNETLLHEVAHGIFDVESVVASLDFGGEAGDDVTEQRANAFAQECLAAPELLRAVASNRGIDWSRLQRMDLATLVADLGAEQRLVVKAVIDAGFVSDERGAELCGWHTADLVRQKTDRALTTEEYVAKVGRAHVPWLERRLATQTPRPFLMPSRYVADVEALYRERRISCGKAARMLMITEAELQERFPLADAGEV